MFRIKAGWVISISGLDGAGKSTLINSLIEKLKERGLRVKFVQVRFGFTPSIKRIKSKFSTPNISSPSDKNQINEKPSFRNKFLWGTYKYISLLDQIIIFGQIKILKSLGVNFITDRYYWDNRIIFQEKFGNPGWFINLHWKLIQYIGGKPTISFMLSIPPSESYNRITTRKHGKQEQTLETLIQREKLYTALENVDLIHIDGLEKRENITNDAWKYIEDIIK